MHFLLFLFSWLLYWHGHELNSKQREDEKAAEKAEAEKHKEEGQEEKAGRTEEKEAPREKKEKTRVKLKYKYKMRSCVSSRVWKWWGMDDAIDMCYDVDVFLSCPAHYCILQTVCVQLMLAALQVSSSPSPSPSSSPSSFSLSASPFSPACSSLPLSHSCKEGWKLETARCRTERERFICLPADSTDAPCLSRNLCLAVKERTKRCSTYVWLRRKDADACMAEWRKEK